MLRELHNDVLQLGSGRRGHPQREPTAGAAFAIAIDETTASTADAAGVGAYPKRSPKAV